MRAYFLDKIVAENEKIKRKTSMEAVGAMQFESLSHTCAIYFQMNNYYCSKGMTRGEKLVLEECLGEILGMLEKIFTSQWYIIIQ